MAALSDKFSDESLYEPSDEIVQKLSRQMIFTMDPNVPTDPSTEDLKKIASNKRVMHLSKKSKRLSKEIRNDVGYVTQSPRNHPLMIEKAKVDAVLVRKNSRLRDKLLDKARKRHFRKR